MNLSLGPNLNTQLRSGIRVWVYSLKLLKIYGGEQFASFVVTIINNLVYLVCKILLIFLTLLHSIKSPAYAPFTYFIIATISHVNSLYFFPQFHCTNHQQKVWNPRCSTKCFSDSLFPWQTGAAFPVSLPLHLHVSCLEVWFVHIICSRAVGNIND